MTNNFSSLILVCAANIALCVLITRIGLRLVAWAERFVSTPPLTVVWDFCLFSNPLVLRFMEWRQKLIDKARQEHNVLLYLAITRTHHILGWFSLIYAILHIVFATDPATRFLHMAENTVAGSMMDLLALLSGSIESNWFFDTILPAAIINFAAAWLFVPRYHQDKDRSFLRTPIQWALNALEAMLFLATTLFFADILNSANWNTLWTWVGNMDIFASPVGKIGCILGVYLLLFPLLRALVCWFRDVASAYAFLGVFMSLSAFMGATGVSSNVNQNALYLACLLVGQWIANLLLRWLEHRRSVRTPQTEGLITPRRLIQWKYHRTSIQPPEYYYLLFSQR